jgi:hypothetical protein
MPTPVVRRRLSSAAGKGPILGPKTDLRLFVALVSPPARKVLGEPGTVGNSIGWKTTPEDDPGRTKIDRGRCASVEDIGLEWRPGEQLVG